MADLPPIMDIASAPADAAQTPPIPEASPEPGPVPSVSKNGTACTCASCTLDAQNPFLFADMPSGGYANSKKRARYTPPQPDINTFATQQAFLDSLAPVPIESIDGNSGKCPICWKPYGEAADPGFDNSEQPVRLKCKHIFGDKCLSATFALPGTSTVALRPLAFNPGSKGRVLGQRLHAFYQEQSSGALDEYTRAFIKMLVTKPESLNETLGQHWSALFRKMRHRTPDASALHKITLLDNASVLDRKHVIASVPALPYEVPGGLSDFEAPDEFGSHLPLIQFPPDNPPLPPSKTEELNKHQKKVKKLAEERDERMAELLKAERDLRELNEREFNRILAAELAQVYSEYLECSPIKEEQEQEATSHRNYFVNAPVVVHKKDLKQSSYEIAPLDRHIKHALQQEDDDSDTNSDEVSVTLDVALEKISLVIVRKTCPDCLSSRMKVPPLMTIPTSLWWKNSRKIPDDCPICHKILYCKDDYRHKPRYLCESPDLGNHDDKAEGEKVS